MSTFVEHYPHPHHPIVDGEPDRSRTVEVFQLRPGDQQRLLDWAGDGILLADGGVILTEGARILSRMALGDFAVRDSGGTVSVVPAQDGFARHYTPAAAG